MERTLIINNAIYVIIKIVVRNHLYLIIRSGVYEVILTIKDIAGNISTHKIRREVLDKKDAGTLKLKVVDSINGKAIPNAYVYINDGVNSTNYRTDNYGIANIISRPGNFRVSAYANDYIPKEETKTIHANVTTEDTITIDKGNIVEGELTSKKLTLEEIIAAGIDINDPDNNHIFEFEINFKFESEKLPPCKVITNGNGNIHGSWGSQWQDNK